MAQYILNGKMIEDTPIYDQSGDGKAHRRKCSNCRVEINVIGARVGKAYLCPICDCKKVKLANSDPR